MYNIGDKIVHPMHGAGIIARIEELEILGERREYYVLDVSCGGMGVKIPVGSCREIGVRPVVDKEEIPKVLEILAREPDRMPDNWNKRYRENMDILKTGDIEAVAGLVRNLTRSEEVKKLSSGEKRMLSNATRILLSEIMLVEDIGHDEAEEMVKKAMMSGKEL